MATFYIQLEDRLLQISGELTAENISKALGYVPADSSALNNYATKDEVSDLVDMSMVEDLSQRVDNITFDSLKDNPFLQDGIGVLNIVDEAGNVVAKVDSEGIHSVDFIAGEHKLTDKIDSTALNGYAKESWVSSEIAKAATEGKVDLTGYATEEWVEEKNYLTEHQDISHLATKQELFDLDFYSIKDNPIINEGNGQLIFVDESGYIGLQLEQDGLHVKDVVADGHILSEKANASELSNYATKDEVSSLVDMSVVEELQDKVSVLVGEDSDKSVREIANDELAKQLLEGNDNFQTLQELSAWIDEHPDSAATMNESIQKNAEDITKSLTSAKSYTDEKVSNIDFYNIKDNPMVDGEAGTITFVDETGYIGLKVTEDGIITKDVVTPEHILSEKANKSFVEDNYYNKSTVDKKITEAVTGGQVSLDGFATEQWVNEQGFLKTHQDISHLAEKSELPTKVSELENDSKFITIEDVPEVIVPTKTSDLTNDSGFITLADVPVQEIPEEYVTETELSQKGYLTEHQNISHLASRIWVESQEYAHQEDLLNISFNDIQGSPITIDESGELNFVDESNNVGLKINEAGIYVKDVIAGNHVLSNKQDVLVDGSNIKTINGQSILGEGNIEIAGGSSSGGSSAYAEVNHGTGDTTFTLTSNTFHVWDEVASLDLSFEDETAGVANEYLFQFTSGATATTLTLPDGLKWANNAAPTIAENMIYQVSVLKGLASVLEFENVKELIENKATVVDGTTGEVSFQYPVASSVTVTLRSDMSEYLNFNSGDINKSLDGNALIPYMIISISPSSDNTYVYTF